MTSKITTPVGENNVSLKNLLGNHWEDHGSYFYLPYDKQKDGMEHLGGKFVTGGKHAAFLGLINEAEQKKVIDYMLYGKKIELIDAKAAAKGLESEPMLREWYDKTVAPLSESVGPAVSKDFPQMLSVIDAKSKDGKGGVEFKTRKYLSGNLTAGKIPLKDYIQIQDHIHAYKLQWCDYVVYAWIKKQIFYRRIYPDVDYNKKIKQPTLDIIREKLSGHVLNSSI